MGIGGHNQGAPWKIGRGGRTIRSFYLKPRTVCQVFAHAGDDRLWDEDDDATVRLLSKAPETVKALRNLITLHNRTGDAGELAGDEWKVMEASDDLAVARGLIAEVDGKGAGNG